MVHFQNRLRKRGSLYQYDRSGNPIFRKDENGSEVYENDGEDHYPEKGNWPFARNESGEPFYAKDAFGNEKYPIRKKRSLLIETPRGPKVAVKASGQQIYPTDKFGNEYYLRDPVTGRPLLLRNEHGSIYFCKHRKGFELIPWNFQNGTGERYISRRDSNGNKIYCKESDMRICFEGYCPVICTCILAVPPFAEALFRIL